MISRRQLATPLKSIFWGFWTICTTAATILLGLKVHLDDSALKQLEVRDKLDAFMMDVRNNQQTYCWEDKQILRPQWQARYESLLELANLGELSSIYAQPCLPAPSAPGLSVGPGSMSASPLAPTYKDWPTFMSAKNKVAALWIRDIPMLIEVDGLDWKSAESAFTERVQRAAQCTREQQEKAEYVFDQLSCHWSLNDNNYPELLIFSVK